MTPRFHSLLVNEAFGDPAVYVDFLHERRALLFDLGDLRPLPPRKLLRVSHVFVSHTHVDHFIGFDHQVRLCLGRDKMIHLFGPPGFVAQVGHRLAGYTWNLVEEYPTDFTVVATEVWPDGKGLTAEFHCLRGFRREGERQEDIDEGILLDEEMFRVRSVFLDHKTPCLAFALEEKQHVNIMKNRLVELGIPTGPWLAGLKRAVLRGEPDDFPVRAWWREGGVELERRFTLGELSRQVLRVVPGQKVAYVTDAVGSRENRAKIVDLARGADYFFVEATFLHAEAERAAERYHLTARQAGEIAREAEVARVIPFHFSPRYQDQEELLRREVEDAFGRG